MSVSFRCRCLLPSLCHGKVWAAGSRSWGIVRTLLRNTVATRWQTPSRNGVLTVTASNAPKTRVPEAGAGVGGIPNTARSFSRLDFFLCSHPTAIPHGDGPQTVRCQLRKPSPAVTVRLQTSQAQSWQKGQNKIPIHPLKTYCLRQKKILQSANTMAKGAQIADYVLFIALIIVSLQPI